MHVHFVQKRAETPAKKVCSLYKVFYCIAYLLCLTLQRDTRKYHYCPFHGCERAVKKLSQHIKTMHPKVTNSERLALCAKAKIAPGRRARKTKPPPKRSLFNFFTSREEEKEKEEGVKCYQDDEDVGSEEEFVQAGGEGCSKSCAGGPGKSRKGEQEEVEGEEWSGPGEEEEERKC